MFQCPLIISGFRVGTKICIIRVELATISREPGPQHPRPGSGEDTAALLRTIADIALCCVRDNNESAKKSAENINESSGQTRNKKVHCVDAKVLVLSVFESFTRKATIQTPDQSPWDAYFSGRGAFWREEYPMNST